MSPAMLSTLGDTLHWLRPQWLWLLLALPLVVVWSYARRRRHNIWHGVVDPHLLPHLLDGAPGASSQGVLWAGVLGGALAIAALAGPSWQRVRQPLWESRAPLVVALDLSSAVLAEDLPSSRLLQARAKIMQLLRSRAGGQVGLIAFADDAYTVAPLTEDAGNVALFLDALSPDVMPVDGSRADRAISESAKLLRQAGFGNGDILVITDHAGSAALTAAKDAHDAGFRVSALGLGTAAGAAYRNADGRIEHARLDAESLQAVSTAGGGHYAALAAGNSDLVTLGVLDPGAADASSARHSMTSIWQDQGYWLLPPLLLVALLAFRRGGALAALWLCLVLPWQPARAVEAGWWQRPDQQAHARLAQGASAYRQGDFAAASSQWRGLPGADAAYDLGNALARQGDYDAAIAAYDRALRMRPGMQDAIANREAVLRAKRQQQPPQTQKQQQPASKPSGKGKGGQQDHGAQSPPQSPGQSGNKGAPDPGNSDQQRAQAQQSGAPDPAQTRQGSGAAPQPSQQKPGDARAQRQADAAQRARMQQALQKGASAAGSEPRARPGPPETAAQRERRIANEAWLRRVPDDPGGLLRAKFQLEYERRQQGGP